MALDERLRGLSSRTPSRHPLIIEGAGDRNEVQLSVTSGNDILKFFDQRLRF
jgi:hypothetical protein